MKDLLYKLKNCTDEEVDIIIEEELRKVILNSKKEEVIGFVHNNTGNMVYKGFIVPETRIRYSNCEVNWYSMKTMDFYYEFARYIRKINIRDNGGLVKYIENFINIYFGINDKVGDFRCDYFDKICFQTTTTDDEYFKKLDSLEIGDLKGQKVAMCTEKAALAQNLLSLFGFETYYCIGLINNNGKEEPHAFNIAKAQKNYRILDYSIPCAVIYNGVLVDYAPFEGDIMPNEINTVLEGIPKSFDSYQYVLSSAGVICEKTGSIRTYAVGEFDLTKNRHNSSIK